MENEMRNRFKSDGESDMVVGLAANFLGKPTRRLKKGTRMNGICYSFNKVSSLWFVLLANFSRLEMVSQQHAHAFFRNL